MGSDMQAYYCQAKQRPELQSIDIECAYQVMIMITSETAMHLIEFHEASDRPPHPVVPSTTVGAGAGAGVGDPATPLILQPCVCRPNVRRYTTPLLFMQSHICAAKFALDESRRRC